MKKFYFSLILIFVFRTAFPLSGNYTILPGTKPSDVEKFDQGFKSKYYLAETLISSSNFNEALNLLKQLDSIVPLNANINYKLGLCYFNSDKKLEAISCFEIASKNINPDYKSIYTEMGAPVLTWFMMAKSYHCLYRFDEAIKYYEKYLASLAKDDKTDIAVASHEIEMCKNGLKLSAVKADKNTFSFTSSSVTTAGFNYPVLCSSDAGMLLFCTAKGINSKSGESKYFYFTQQDSSKWNEPVSLDNGLNTVPVASSNKLTFQSKQIFYSQTEDGNLELYSITYTDGKWGVPEKLSSNINTKFNEANACLSPDGNTLYFSSNKEGGYGGYDLYTCEKLSNGSWSKPVNMGSDINTPFDENTPYMLKDGSTLYFSSKGHNSIGGYDVFTATLSDEGIWSQVENIGYPVNTPQDDAFFIPASNEKSAFYSTTANCKTGDSEIVFIILE